MNIVTSRICACPDLLDMGADLWEEEEEVQVRGRQPPIFGEVILALIGKSSFCAHGNNAFPVHWCFSGAPCTTGSGSRSLLMPCLSFPIGALRSVFSHAMAQNPHVGMSGYPSRSSRRGEKRKTLWKGYNPDI